jgi:hypothetical protein
MKKIFLLSFLTISLFAEAFDYSKLDKNRADVSKFSNLDYKGSQTKAIDPDQFEKIPKDTNVFKQMKQTETFYNGDEYITKKEFKDLSTKINNISKEASKPQDFILYLSSESVPNNTLLNVMLSIGILQENNIDINSKIYLMGPPDDFENYMNSLKNDLVRYPITTQEMIARNVNLKLDPRFFNIFDLKKAPAIIFATCPSQIPDPKTCDFKYLMRGDMSLASFFDKIKNIEPKYEKYYSYLISNKFEEVKKDVKK